MQPRNATNEVQLKLIQQKINQLDHPVVKNIALVKEEQASSSADADEDLSESSYCSLHTNHMSVEEFARFYYDFEDEYSNYDQDATKKRKRRRSFNEERAADIRHRKKYETKKLKTVKTKQKDCTNKYVMPKRYDLPSTSDDDDVISQNEGAASSKQDQIDLQKDVLDEDKDCAVVADDNDEVIYVLHQNLYLGMNEVDDVIITKAPIF